MAIAPKCNACGKELKEFGALLFGPPKANQVKKEHFCQDCYKGLSERRSFDLKKGVDFIGVTCVFYCHDGKGNLLMHKRSQNCRDEKGRWTAGLVPWNLVKPSSKQCGVR